MKDLEREVELLREKVRLLERLRELEGKPPVVPYYPVPYYVPVEPWPHYQPWTGGDHTGTWWPNPNIITSDGNITAGSDAVTTGTVTNHESNNVTWTQ